MRDCYRRTNRKQLGGIPTAGKKAILGVTGFQGTREKGPGREKMKGWVQVLYTHGTRYTRVLWIGEGGGDANSFF